MKPRVSMFPALFAGQALAASMARDEPLRIAATSSAGWDSIKIETPKPVMNSRRPFPIMPLLALSMMGSMGGLANFPGLGSNRSFGGHGPSPLSFHLRRHPVKVPRNDRAHLAAAEEKRRRKAQRKGSFKTGNSGTQAG